MEGLVILFLCGGLNMQIHDKTFKLTSGTWSQTWVQMDVNRFLKMVMWLSCYILT